MAPPSWRTPRLGATFSENLPCTTAHFSVPMLRRDRNATVLSSSTCKQSCCAARWPEVCPHRPPDACGRGLLMTGICAKEGGALQRYCFICGEHQRVICRHACTSQSSPAGPGPSPSPPAPTSLRPGRRPPRTAAGPTAWNVLYLNTGNADVQCWTHSAASYRPRYQHHTGKK